MYADIIQIDAPASAAVGDTVIIDVSVKNISNNDWNIAVTAGYESTGIPFQFDYLLVSPGQTVIFRGWFTMPSKNVKVTACGWYWDSNNWVQDDQMTKDISVAVLTPQVSDFRIADFYKV